MQAMTFRPCASAFAAFAPTKSLLSFSRLRLSECPSITHGMLMSASCSGAICTTEDRAEASMRTQIMQSHTRPWIALRRTICPPTQGHCKLHCCWMQQPHGVIILILMSLHNPDLDYGLGLSSRSSQMVDAVYTGLSLLHILQDVPAQVGASQSPHLACVGACPAYPAVLSADLVARVDVVNHIG